MMLHSVVPKNKCVALENWLMPLLFRKEMFRVSLKGSLDELLFPHGSVRGSVTNTYVYTDAVTEENKFKM